MIGSIVAYCFLAALTFGWIALLPRLQFSDDTDIALVATFCAVIWPAVWLFSLLIGAVRWLRAFAELVRYGSQKKGE